MTKIFNKYMIAFIIIILVFVLAVSARPTQAGLPGQTVPTAKQPGQKNSNGSKGDESPTAAPLRGAGLPTDTPTPTPTSTTTPAGSAAGNSLTTQAVENTAKFSQTPLARGTVTSPYSKLIPVFLPTDPSHPYRYFYYAIIGVVCVFLVVFFIIRRNQKLIPPIKKKDGSD